MILLPDAGVGAFVFNNKTYTGLSVANFRTLLILRRAGVIFDRPLTVSAGLAKAYEFAKQAWTAASVEGLPLAVNIPLDKDLPRRARELTELKQRVGACAMSEAVSPVSAMEGRFEWTCAKGKIAGHILRAPTSDFQLQLIDLEAVSED